MTYEEKLAEEAALWGDEAARQARSTPPDWRCHRHLRHNRVLHARYINEFLAHVQPGMQALELGCASGWLTLAMAQRGAHALGLDISEGALDVARAYYEQIKNEVAGTVQYRAADLNTLELPPAAYDVIAVKATLHHLVELPAVVAALRQALRPGGLLWIEDTRSGESLSSTLLAGALSFLLPTQVSYRQKLGALLHFGRRAPERVRASMEAEGLSPFEGAGRDHDWLALVREHFEIERETALPAVTGYVTAQLRLGDRLALPLLHTLRGVDTLLVRLGLLRSSGVVVYARRRAAG